MNLSFEVPSPISYFASLVQSDADFPLLEAAISLAQDEYPDLDVQQVLGEVDQLLARVQAPRAGRRRPYPQVARRQPVFLPRPELSRQRQQLLRPGQQLPERGAAHPLRDSDLAGGVVAGAGAGPGPGRAGRGFPGPFHGQGQPAQGPGGDRPARRPVAEPRSSWPSGWSPIAGAAAWWTSSRCRWACTCRPRRRARSSRACCATSRRSTAPRKTGRA